MQIPLPLIGFLLLLRGQLFLVIRETIKQIGIGRPAPALAVAFQRPVSPGRPRLLFVGDSTVVGTGADRPDQTVVGYFGQAYPDARIVNGGQNGTRTATVVKQLRRVTDQHFDVIIILVGGNDVVQFTSDQELPAAIDSVLTLARRIGTHVLLMSQGNIGNAPLFPPFFSRLFTRRSRRLREIFRAATDRHGVMYIDPFVERGEDRWLKNPAHYYSADRFHPNGIGYREWFGLQRETMIKAGWLPRLV
ncbi:MAG: GDSL family lipase [Candidatus Kerfeldbacteria bacterium]|nr:GDSL family lipase [Candidatus Kerfeldbacteria bacterium]